MSLNKSKQAFDHLLKLIIVGDAGVGKTCMLLRFSEENFQNPHIATIGEFFFHVL
jgi:GTPase SAR1 family protein